ncbi:MAG: DNA repair protein RecN [Bacteroidaceae bacterium]|nr:DNA repair protein RecN [Bacteroidaceae bacterium]
MLHTLYIQDYALIRQLEICFEQGFSVITGETGAGKSVMLGALGLLLGQRADTKAIRTGASKCVIEAHFLLEDNLLQPFFEENELEFETECILRREVYASGKSRAFINDTPVQLSQMKELGEQLIDIHSQHQNLLLGKEDFQLGVLDIVAGNGALLNTYRQDFSRWKQRKQELQDLLAQIAQDKADEDYVQFQYNQLEETALQEGEQEELEQEAEMLNHAEEIKSGLYRAGQILSSEDGGLLAELRDSKSALQSILSVYPAASELFDRLESSYIELEDIAQELEHQADLAEFDPQRLDVVNDRLNLIYSLQQKHHVQTVEALLQIQADFAARLKLLNHSEEDVEQLTKECDSMYRNLIKQAEQLTKNRNKASKQIEKQMVEMLIPQGMPNVRFQVEIGQKKELSETGADAVNFRFSANKNGTLQPISQVASGGEIARVMLSVKALISGAVALPTIIFDEIDTGVSGNIADRMALIMQDMGAKGRQVISITHLPQIAARGAVHYKVYKQDTETETISHITRLSKEERVEEIAHMLSGATLTTEALNNARALLAENNIEN